MNDLVIEEISPYDIDIDSIDNDSAIEIYENLDSGEIEWPKAIGLDLHVSVIDYFVQYVLDEQVIVNIDSLFKGSVKKVKEDWKNLRNELETIDDPKSAFYFMSSSGFDDEGYQKYIKKLAPSLKSKLTKIAKLLDNISSFHANKRPYYLYANVLLGIKKDVELNPTILENEVESYYKDLSNEESTMLKSIADQDDATVLDLILRLETILNNIELLLKSKSLDDFQKYCFDMFSEINDLGDLVFQYNAFKALSEKLYHLNFEKS